jgi:catechol 2,3-dioxygenase-like lactoylglutathione lyase family enzyme
MSTTATPSITTLKAHLAVNVRDVERSVEFYKKMFGIEPSKVRTGYAKFDVQNPPLNFTLNQASFEKRGALSHLGIQVSSTEDVVAMRDAWRERGLETRDEMKTDCCYAVQDKAWVHDPDGNAWEVFVVLEDNLPELPERTSCCSTTDDASCGTPISISR